MYKNYQYELFSTSWGIHEGFKTAVDKLNELLPFEGRVEYSQSKNKNLEKFRKAQNAMYDLFNNGLCNKKNEFRKIFGFTYSKTHEWNKTQWFYVEEIMETHFTPIIQNAIKEQGVI
jgi:hypothetical protein